MGEEYDLGIVESSREIWVHSFSLGLGGSLDLCRILNKTLGAIGVTDLQYSKREHMPTLKSILGEMTSLLSLRTSVPCHLLQD